MITRRFNTPSSLWAFLGENCDKKKVTILVDKKHIFIDTISVRIEPQ